MLKFTKINNFLPTLNKNNANEEGIFNNFESDTLLAMLSEKNGKKIKIATNETYSNCSGEKN